MADSIREKVIDNVVATIEGITTVGGYNTNIKKVHKVQMPSTEAIIYPTAIVTPGNETYEDIPIERLECNMEIAIDCHLEQYKDITKESSNAISDMKKALLVDRQRSGNAIETKMGSSTFAYEIATKPLCTMTLNIIVKYRHVNNDPYTLG